MTYPNDTAANAELEFYSLWNMGITYQNEPGHKFALDCGEPFPPPQTLWGIYLIKDMKAEGQVHPWEDLDVSQWKHLF